MNQEENNQNKLKINTESGAVDFAFDNQNKLKINTESGAVDFAFENQSDSGAIFEEHGTFCRVGSVISGILEVDLQSIKQKGVEVRNISFAIPLGNDENNNPIKAEMLFMDEKEFDKFKAFIAQLNWND